jgi:hypothetical protein
MDTAELSKLAEGLIVLAGVAAVVFAVFKNQTTQQTIRSQKELIETLTTQVNELRTLHLENEKAIAKLTGQVEVYKELPLTALADSMQKLVDTQTEILKILKRR